MVSYPLHVPLNGYRGQDPRKKAKTAEYNRVAQRVEAYINNDLAAAGEHVIRVYISRYVASDLREDPELVTQVIFGIDCGHNGVTVTKGDYNRAVAEAERN